ncbi:hypothetical protein [Roseomonas chloroacetimidivorans]|uniref:hypothetical protein n=1 Tax=Roseomonas chloroacetimidivorans TaxID=1766656 RepID=UPI003C757E65
MRHSSVVKFGPIQAHYDRQAAARGGRRAALHWTPTPGENITITAMIVSQVFAKALVFGAIVWQALQDNTAPPEPP